MKNIKKIYILLIIILLILIGILCYFIFKSDDVSNKNYNLVLFGDTNIQITEGDIYEEFGYYAILDGEIVTEDVQVINNINEQKSGKYEILYKYRDITKKRQIIVLEKEKENGYLELSLVGSNKIILNIGDTYQELGAKATYNGKDISSYIKIDKNINTNLSGNYIITYSVSYNNESKSITRDVLVNEKLKIDVSYDTKITNQNINVSITAFGTDFLYLKLPDNSIVDKKNISYEIKENGIYEFFVYDKNNHYEKKEIVISNIDKEKPTGKCTGKYENNKTIINVDGKDNLKIDYYLYNDIKTSNDKYTFNSIIDNVKVSIFDQAGNVNQIACNIKSSGIEMHFIVTTSDDDAILIRSDVATIMIDGGQYDSRHKVISYLDKIGVKKIDALIGSHIQYNHVQEQGPIINKYQVDKAIYSIDIKNCKSMNICDSNDIKYVLNALQEKNIKIEIKNAGDYMEIGDMKLYFLGPLVKNKSHNKNSLIFILEHNGKKYMFTGDAESENSAYWDIKKFQTYADGFGINLDVDFFKWPHHGINKISDEFFNVTKPEYVLVPNYHGCSNLDRRSGGKKQMKKLGITFYELCDGKDVYLKYDGTKIEMGKVSNPESFYRS